MDAKQIVYIVSLLAAILIGAIVLYKYKSTEGFWMLPARSWYVQPEIIGQEQPGPMNGVDFFQVPNFDSIISPRFSNVNYGPDLRTSLPDARAMAMSQDPIDLQRYRSDYGVSSYANGDYKKVLAKISGMDTDMDAFQTEAMLGPDITQPIVYDRYIVANKQSKLRALGDPIRGDLPIVPNTGNWFVPSVHPNIDLQAGAINVLAGFDNENSKQLAQLIYASSGGADTTIGGLNLAGMNQYLQGSTAAGGDITVTSFP